MDNVLLAYLKTATRQYQRALEAVKHGLDVCAIEPDDDVLQECRKALERLGFDGDRHAAETERVVTDRVERAVRDAMTALQIEVC